MLNSLDERGRQAIRLARLEAYERRFSYVGTESLVVGVLREAQGRQGDELDPWGLSIGRVRAAVAQRVGSGLEPVGDPATIPLTPRAIEVLEHAERAAQRLGSERITPEHILLALLEVGQGEALIALKNLGAPIKDLHRDVERSLEPCD